MIEQKVKFLALLMTMVRATVQNNNKRLGQMNAVKPNF